MSPLRRSILATLLVTAVLASPPGIAPASAAVTMTPGIPWTGAVGIHRSVAQIMGLQAPEMGQGAEPRMAEVEKEWPDRSHLPQSPQSIDQAQWPPAEAGVQAAPGQLEGITSGPQTPALTFTGATLSGINPTFSFPADGMGAAGPTQYVVFVNGRLVSFNKTTGLADGALNADPDVFFGGINNGSSTSDPRIRYDRLSGRWFLVIINTSTPNWVLLGVSDAASNGVISGSTVFSLFFFPIDTPPPAIASNCFADYPTLGVDANALYIGVNEFCGAPLTFNSCDGFVVRKSSVMSGGPLVVTALRGLVPNAASDGPYVPQGVDNYDPASTEGYFIGVSNTLFGKLVLRRVSTPGGTPSVSGDIGITVSSTSFPLKVPHLGNTGANPGRLDGLDDRLYAAHLRNGRLWTAQAISVNNTGTTTGTRTRNGSRWYELAGIVSPGVPSVFQSGTVFTASATNLTDQPHFWMPSIMVSGQGHALLGFSTAGTNVRIDAAATGRLAGDALGTMAAPANYTFSSTAYNPPGDPGGAGGRRWGDYSMTSLDPIDDMTMWTLQEFCDVTNSYGCQIVKMLAPLPAAPTSAPDVMSALASTPATVVGTSTAGSGFFDPGADLGGGLPAYSHLSAVITNTGVTGTPPTVNSATYIDPTHVQLDLNTNSATPNLPGEKYSVVITNPDGQSATGSMILRVTQNPVGVGDGPAAGFALGPVWPNPARLGAAVDFSVARETRVRVSVIDLEGREVATLVDGVRSAGTHHVAWAGDASRAPAPAGIYFMRYEAAGNLQVRRFVLLR
jgi:hypothetical protein